MANTGLQLFQGRTEYPATTTLTESPGLNQGVYISIEPERLHDISEMFARWFKNRDEVDIIDVGTSDKQDLGFIIIEWIECDMDQLFIDILKSEDAILDFTMYSREVE